MHFLKSLTATLILAASPLSAEWGWYSGDVATFSAGNTSSTIPESVHNAVETGLDWVVLSAPPGSGDFVGMEELINEVKLTVPRLTPILGAGWSRSGTGIRILGVDARAPLPDHLADLLPSIASHGGAAVFETLDTRIPETSQALVFSPVTNGKWASAVDTGGLWDQALTEGRRIFLASASHGTPPGSSHRTVLWAERNQADQLIESLKSGASYITEGDGIHVDLQVGGKRMGQTVFHRGETFIRIKAYARDPISSVSLVADGEEVWSASPDTNVWEERFFLPAGDVGYVRLVCVSEVGGYRSVGNPVFLVSESPEEGELPITDAQPFPRDGLVEMSGLLEASVGLPEDAQARILREFLAGTKTRYGTCWLLQNRTDVVSDAVLVRLATQDPDDQVRLGAAYALVVRSSSAAPDVLLHFLETGRHALEAYAARIFAQYTEGFTEADWVWSDTRGSEANAFMIRAYRPTRFSEDHVGMIIKALGSDRPSIAYAAQDKLIELGTRHYRVIQLLLAAAESGAAPAADVLGQIGDHRTIGALRNIFQKTETAEVRRSVFLALDAMGAPYPDRQTLSPAALTAAPELDGRVDPKEWEGASILSDLKNDWNGAARQPSGVKVRAGTHADSLYFAVTKTVSAPPVATLTDGASTRPDHLIELSLASAPYDRAENDNRLYIRINALGIVECEGDVCRAVSRVTPGSWEVEVALSADAVEPYSRLNLSVVAPGTSTPRLAWSVTYGAPDNPGRYGDLRLEGDIRE